MLPQHRPPNLLIYLVLNKVAYGGASITVSVAMQLPLDITSKIKLVVMACFALTTAIIKRCDQMLITC